MLLFCYYFVSSLYKSCYFAIVNCYFAITVFSLQVMLFCYNYSTSIAFSLKALLFCYFAITAFSLQVVLFCYCCYFAILYKSCYFAIVAILLLVSSLYYFAIVAIMLLLSSLYKYCYFAIDSILLFVLSVFCSFSLISILQLLCK